MEYGCIGEKLGHSFSKTIHNMFADYDYALKELSADMLDEFMTKKQFKGINVTIPYKQSVIPYLDYTDSKALQIGAVNTIVNKDGKLHGYNTDFYGMSALIKKMGLDLENKTVAVLGSGGTSKTAFAVANSMGAKSVFKVSRSGKDGSITYERLYELGQSIEIIINTTPCGMYPQTENAAVDLDRLPRVCGVVDAVYNPLRTKLVMQALEKGITASGGLYMLVAQAVRAAELFTGREFGRKVTDRVYSSLVKQKENIVLVGMAGCGKSTVGKRLADILEREFIDSDAKIVEKHGNIPDIFKNVGESGFRKIESETITEISQNSGVVIATGGGVVLDKNNVTRLKRNGIIVFMDRDINNIMPTSDRPLSDDRQKLTALFEKRYPIYKACADRHLKMTEDVQENAGIIIDECFNK